MRPAEPLADPAAEPERRERPRGARPEREPDPEPQAGPHEPRDNDPDRRGIRPRNPRVPHEPVPVPVRPRPRPPVHNPPPPPAYDPWCDNGPIVFVEPEPPVIVTYIEPVPVYQRPIVNYPPAVPNPYAAVQNTLGVLALTATALNTWAMVSDNSHPAASFGGVVIGTSAILSAAPYDRHNAFATTTGVLALGTGIASFFIGDGGAVSVGIRF